MVKTASLQRPKEPEPTPGFEGIYTLAMKGGNPQIRALMRTISYCEGTGTKKNSYFLIFGGETFEGEIHPNQEKKFGETLTTAAGRYQMIHETWYRWSRKYINEDFPTFTPKNQDFVVYNKLKEEIGSKLEGDFVGAVEFLSSVWASLPGGKQQRLSMSEFTRIYAGLLEEEKLIVRGMRISKR